MSQPGNRPPKWGALPAVEGVPKYITGETALDVVRLTGLSLDPAGKFIDVSRLSWVDRLRVTLAMVGAHYYCDVQEGITRPRPAFCVGCHHGWPVSQTSAGFPIHTALDRIGGTIGCNGRQYEIPGG